jgi:hypothetical protein
LQHAIDKRPALPNLGARVEQAVDFFLGEEATDFAVVFDRLQKWARFAAPRMPIRRASA